MPSMLSEYAAGMLFGSALFAAGVFAPGTIIAQMRLEDFTMAKAMIGASGVSAYVFPSPLLLTFFPASDRCFDIY